MSQQIGMHEAYRIARSCGYKKDQPVSYQVMTAIVASAYQKGKEEADKSLTVKRGAARLPACCPFLQKGGLL